MLRKETWETSSPYITKCMAPGLAFHFFELYYFTAGVSEQLHVSRNWCMSCKNRSQWMPILLDAHLLQDVQNMSTICDFLPIVIHHVHEKKRHHDIIQFELAKWWPTDLPLRVTSKRITDINKKCITLFKWHDFDDKMNPLETISSNKTLFFR